MIAPPEILLIAAVAGIGVLHTIVPDHWVPITLIGRQHHWAKHEVARAAFVAGLGHTVSTLIIGIFVWLAGIAFATKFGNLVSAVSSIALIGFGGRIAISSLQAMRHEGHGHTHSHSHASAQPAHADGLSDPHSPHHGSNEHDGDTLAEHSHSNLHPHDRNHNHGHSYGHAHDHEHSHSPVKTRSLRTTLLLILGSSPMVEGLPAFFAAGRYGIGLIVIMSIVFAISTIATYVILCVYSTASLQRVKLGRFEQYGEVLSGAFIALVGAVFSRLARLVISFGRSVAACFDVIIGSEYALRRGASLQEA